MTSLGGVRIGGGGKVSTDNLIQNMAVFIARVCVYVRVWVCLCVCDVVETFDTQSLALRSWQSTNHFNFPSFRLD